MTDPNGAIYGVPWIPSTYPRQVSMYPSTMDPERPWGWWKLTEAMVSLSRLHRTVVPCSLWGRMGPGDVYNVYIYIYTIYIYIQSIYYIYIYNLFTIYIYICIQSIYYIYTIYIYTIYKYIKKNIWLVVSNLNGLFSIWCQLDVILTPLTNSYFSRCF